MGGETVARYIHGTDTEEQDRLAKLNELTNKSFIEYLGDLDNLNVCDFGCGLGLVVRDIADKFDGVKVTGLEISEEQIEKARMNNSGLDNVELIHTDVMKNNISDNTFDVTYCRYVLEHLENPVEAIEEMLRITKPGGRIICQENDLYNGLIYPEITGYAELRKKLCDLQIEFNGDPYIGRKLYTIMKEGGAEDISIDLAPEIHTADDTDGHILWLNNIHRILMDVRSDFIEKEYTTEKNFDEVCTRILERIEKPEGACLFQWNRATAYKKKEN